MLALIPENFKIHSLELRPILQLFQDLAHSGGNLCDIAAGSPLDFNPHGVFSVDAIYPIPRRRRQLHGGDIRQLQIEHRVDAQGADFLDAADLTDGTHEDFFAPLAHVAPGQREVLVAQAAY